jgi:hypothetical protein
LITDWSVIIIAHLAKMSTEKVDLDFFTLPKLQAHPGDRVQEKSLENPQNCHFEAFSCDIFIEVQKT